MPRIDTGLLIPFGWNAHFEAQYVTLCASARDGADETSLVEPARVASLSRGFYDVLTTAGARRTTCAGRLRHEAHSAAASPAVGDWVGLRTDTRDGPIVHVFERSTVLARKHAGRRADAQVIAANVDTVFVVSALNAEFNVRRLERFLAMVLEAGARPVFVLNKADLCDDPTPFVSALREVAPTVPIERTSAARGEGLDRLRALAAEGETIALVGSSGVGKSALTNRLLGRETQREGATREYDERGRHTTAHRELFVVPGGALLIDTPGLRELALWTDDDRASLAGFDDLEAFVAACRFSDCSHGTEPDCAVRAAVESGALTPERLEAWQKLGAEQAALRARNDAREALARKGRDKSLTRLVRQVTRLKKR